MMVWANKLLDLMKEYVSLTTAAMTMSKDFTVIIATIAKRKKGFIG